MYEALGSILLSATAMRRLLQSDKCTPSSVDSCRDPGLAQRWAIGALFLILIGGIIGVTLPLLSRNVRWLGIDSIFFVLGRAFAAGVVLATGFVHMFPGAMDALTNPCLGWGAFPWASCIAVAAALVTNLTEFMAGQVLHAGALAAAAAGATAGHTCGREHALEDGACGGALVDQEEATAQTMENGSVDPPLKPRILREDAPNIRLRAAGQKVQAHGHDHSRPVHSDGSGTAEDRVWAKARKHAVAQILEIGVSLHSVLVGIALGVSPSPCTIRSLAVALAFHQSFEGFALGGSLIDAEYETGSFLSMALVFALTTPAGVALGLGIRHNYNDHSPAALGVSGVFNSISTGVLVYMALVDLIAVDFFSERMRSARRLHQFWAYFFLFAGAAVMGLIAKWA